MVTDYTKYYRRLCVCVDCGKLHWTQSSKEKPRYQRCRSCGCRKGSTGRKVSIETRTKISQSLIGHPVSDKARIGHKWTPSQRDKWFKSNKDKKAWNKGKKMNLSEGARQVISERIKLMWASEGFKEKMSKQRKGKFAGEKHPLYGKHPSQETIEKTRMAKLGSHVSAEARRNLQMSHSSPEFRQKQSNKMKELHANPLSVYNSEEYRQKCSAIMKARHKDPNSKIRSSEVLNKHTERLMRYVKAKKLCNYNKTEQKLDIIIQKVLPNQYKYNGGMQLGFRIHYHTPDFVNVNGQKKIIELNGCVWHCCPICGIERHPIKKSFEQVRAKDNKNVADAEALGYKVLIIWEHDLNDEKMVAQKLLAFNQPL